MPSKKSKKSKKSRKPKEPEKPQILTLAMLGKLIARKTKGFDRKGFVRAQCTADYEKPITFGSRDLLAEVTRDVGDNVLSVVFKSTTNYFSGIEFKDRLEEFVVNAADKYDVGVVELKTPLIDVGERVGGKRGTFAYGLCTDNKTNLTDLDGKIKRLVAAQKVLNDYLTKNRLEVELDDYELGVKPKYEGDRAVSKLKPREKQPLSHEEGIKKQVPRKIRKREVPIRRKEPHPYERAPFYSYYLDKRPTPSGEEMFEADLIDWLAINKPGLDWDEITAEANGTWEREEGKGRSPHTVYNSCLARIRARNRELREKGEEPIKLPKRHLPESLIKYNRSYKG